MKIKLLTSMACDQSSHAPGEVIDVEDAYAQRMIQSGQAEPVAPPAKREKRVKAIKEAR